MKAPMTISRPRDSIHHSANAWAAVVRAAHACRPNAEITHTAWLETMLARNHGCAYLRRYGAPRTLAVFRAQIPLCTYEDLRDDMAQIAAGASDVLFAGRPVAYEKQGAAVQAVSSSPTPRRAWPIFNATCCRGWQIRCRRFTSQGGHIFPSARQPGRLNPSRACPLVCQMALIWGHRRALRCPT